MKDRFLNEKVRSNEPKGKFISIGHLTIDELFYEGRKVKERLGGSVSYGSMAAVSLGWDVSIVSIVGSDMPRSFLKALSSAGIDISNVKVLGNESTRFRLDVSGRRKVLSRPKSAPKIRPQDVPEDIVRADAVFLGLVGMEVDLNLIEEIRKRAKGIVAIDLQGFLRRIGPNGTISLVKNERAFNACSLCDVIHLSLEESFVLTEKAEPRKALKVLLDKGASIVSITMGERGAFVGSTDEILLVPAVKPRALVDDVGAGDVFIAVLSSCLAEGMNLRDSSSIATAAASLSIELDGPSSLRRDEIERRALLAKRSIRRA